MFNYPDRLLKEGQINPWFLRADFPEVPQIAKDIVENKRMIVEVASKENRGGEMDDKNDLITLFDVFRVVDKTRFPFLWETVLRVFSYIPTSVSCEQSFSILKRRMHQNMKSENAFMFVEMAKRNKVIEFK